MGPGTGPWQVLGQSPKVFRSRALPPGANLFEKRLDQKLLDIT